MENIKVKQFVKIRKTKFIFCVLIFLILIIFCTLIIVFQSRQTENLFIFLGTLGCTLFIASLVYQYTMNIFPLNRKIKLFRSLYCSELKQSLSVTIKELTKEETYEGVLFSTFIAADENNKIIRLFIEPELKDCLEIGKVYQIAVVHNVVLDYMVNNYE